ncbi:MAG TPA: right-handed parallel beta-helix repeat-containing protein [Bacteroidota bacterium]|nr:right-handed parallel beta-helix repeat-containing protein [Bacteroidota bacterium]
MRISTIIISFFLFVGTGYAQTNLSGTIAADSVLTPAGNPYIVTGDVTVNAPHTLTVDSGVVVRFQANTGLYILGHLNARWAAFTSNKDTAGGFAQKGDWSGIQVGNYGMAGTALLDTCQVKYSGGVQADLYLVSGSAWINGCSISNSSKDCIVNMGGSLTLQGTTVSNASGNGLSLSGTSTTTVNASTISFSSWPVWCGASTAAILFNGVNNFMSNASNGINMAFTYSGSMVLDTASIPYVFLQDFYINSGAVVTVCAGNVLKFGNGAHLNVNGGFSAVGSINHPISFTSYKDDNLDGDTNGDGTTTAPSVNDWGGVVFEDQSVDSLCVMKYCAASFAGYGGIGAVTMYNANPVIDSCTMANNHFGAMIQGTSSPMFSNNTIGSSELVPIAMSFSANPVFNNNAFSFSDNAYDAIGIIGETLSANASLPIRSVTSKTNVTYLLLGTVVVPTGKTLNINKGIVIKAYSPDQHIAVQGKLVANGTSDSLIVFTSAKDDVFGNPHDTNKDGTATNPAIGDWSGIVFEPNSDSASVLNYCRITYADLEPYYLYQYNSTFYYKGEITILNASPTISNCQIGNARYGIYAALSSNPHINNNSIFNTDFTPIAISTAANPAFVGNTFTNVAWTALGLIGENVVANGTIPQRTVAGIVNITYVLLGDIMINSGVYVTVSPGVVVKSGGPGIYVNGGFKAKGTAAGGMVTFTSLKDDNVGNPHDTNGDGAATFPGAGDWSTIRFQGTSDDAFCLLDSCILKFGGNTSSLPNQNSVAWGLVTFTDAGGTISNCTLSDSYNFGLRCENSSTPAVSKVSIINCKSDPIGMSLLANPVFSNITFTANLSKGIRILEGTLSSDAILATRNIAGITNVGYMIDQLIVAPGAVLTIQPGVVIKFIYNYYYSYGIMVEGALIANGTPSQPIVFTSFKDDSNGGDTNNDGNATTPNPGDWSSVDFTASSSDSLNSLQYCYFRYGGVFPYALSGDMSYKWALLRVYDAYVNVNHCTFEQSGTAGVGVFGSAHPSLVNSNIYNVKSTPVALSMFSNPSFSTDSALNVGYMALGVVPETYSFDATVPVRNFGGYNDITYFLFSTCSINTGTTITVPAGIVFKNGQWVVNGGLTIKGTSSNPDVFTDPADDAYGNPKDTNGDGSATKPTIQSFSRITFNDVSVDSICAVRYGIFRFTDVGVSLQQAAPAITHCIFDSDNWGVSLNSVSTPSLDSCLFRNLVFAPMDISLVSYPRSTLADSICGTTYKAIGVITETLASDVTLAKRTFGGIHGIPYFFNDYTVGSNAVLTIAPGVILKFTPGTGMNVNKGLIAVGAASADSTIVFTDIRDDFYGGDTNSDTTTSHPTDTYWNGNWSYAYQGWTGISFADQSLDPMCTLSHCAFRYAGINQTWINNMYMYGAAVMAFNASPTITYSSLTNNGNGVAAFGSSNPAVNYCDIYNNLDNGINNVNKSFDLDARWNWWGNNSGPTNAGNPDGTGQTVTDSVNYVPFLGSGSANPIAGDVSLNGYVQAYDASLILKYVVNPSGDTLNAIQQSVADVSGAMGITAYDASLVLQYVVGLINVFPSEIASSTKQLSRQGKELIALEKATHALLTVESTGAGRGDSLVVMLDLQNAAGVASAEITLKYDPSVFTFLKGGTTDASNGFSFESFSNQAAGTTKLALAGTGVMKNSGAFAYAAFRVSNDVRGTIDSKIEVERFVANETDLTSSAAAGSIKVVGKPTSYSLDQNYPNPFNPSTTIGYQLPEDNTHVRLTIYSMTGQAVKTLVDENQKAGTYRVVWNGTNNAGAHISSGVYFYRMTAGKFVQVKKLLLLK